MEIESESEAKKLKRRKLIEMLNIAFLSIGIGLGIMTAVIHYNTLKKMK